MGKKYHYLKATELLKIRAVKAPKNTRNHRWFADKFTLHLVHSTSKKNPYAFALLFSLSVDACSKRTFFKLGFESCSVALHIQIPVILKNLHKYVFLNDVVKI